MSRGADKPTLIDGKLANVSATQVKTFRMCPRKWYYTKVEKLPQKPQGKGAQLGEQCHKRMERWLLTGEDVRGPIERHGHEMIEPYLKFAPFNGGPMQIEADVAGVLKTPGGVAVNGFIDVYIPTNPGLLHPVVIDHKFKKDLAKWADNEDALRDDEQFIIYGAFAAMVEPNALSLEFRHHNHQTNARRNLPVPVSATRDEVLEKFFALTKTIDYGMATNAALGKGRATDVPCRTSACSAFGGCDFELQCPDSPRNRASSNIFGLTVDSLTVKNAELPEVQEDEDMRYLGGKSRLAKAIVAKIAEVVGPGFAGKVFEPFCGGAAVTLELAKRWKVLASDLFPGLAQMHADCAAGFRLPPHGCTEAEYAASKKQPGTPALAIQFGLSFGGKYGGGLARPPEEYAGHFNSFAAKLQAVATNISWRECGYDECKPSPGDLVYCDPPYAGTTGYATGEFDHAAFWRIMTEWADSGVHVFVSEFTGHPGFTEVWRKERSVGVDARAGYSTKIDLLVYRGPADISRLTADSLTVKNVESPEVQEVVTMGLMDQMMKSGRFAAELAKVVAPAEPTTVAPAESAQAAKEEAAVETASIVANPATVEAAKQVVEELKKTPKQRAKKVEELTGLTLLVDCFSSRAQDITPWALDLAKQLAQRHGVQDIRVAPKESDLSYGGWRAAIAAEALKVPPTGVAYLAGSELTEPIIEALTGVASMVIRGRR